MTKLVYNGPPGFAVAGQNLEPGEEIELDDETAESLAEHPHFEQAGAKKTAKKEEK